MIEKKGRIRAGSAADYFALSRISSEVFSIYGDYTEILPGYLLCEFVKTFIYEIDEDFAGFIQVFIDEKKLKKTRVLNADVLSVAVTTRHQGRGVGTALFEHLLRFMDTLAEKSCHAEIQLTVAHTNNRAIKFFRRLGFELDGRETGNYSGGQRALVMSRCLKSRPDQTARTRSE